jgi:tol-pal system protein YbgF
MEEEGARGAQLQDDLDALRTQVEKQGKEIRAEKPKQTNPKGIAELLGEIDQLKEQFRRLEGRIEEEGRKTSEAVRATDDQTHNLEQLSNKISSIEKRLSTEKKTSDETGPILSPSEAYTLAYNDYLRGNYDLSILGFQNYLSLYPHSTNVPQALYWIGQAYYNKAAYTEAISFFEQIETRFPQHDTAPNAMLKTGLSLVELGKMDLAKATLQKVTDKFPQSNEAQLAKGKLATMP